MNRKLPIEIQSIERAIGENRVYIDKTDMIYNLINSEDYCFLSRPAESFGKNCLVL